MSFASCMAAALLQQSSKINSSKAVRNWMWQLLTLQFFACFRPYVGQPDDHIGWATSMPFASIYPTNPRTNPWNFPKKMLRIGGVENLSFWVGHLELWTTLYVLYSDLKCLGCNGIHSSFFALKLKWFHSGARVCLKSHQNLSLWFLTNDI